MLRVVGDVHGCVDTSHPMKDLCYLDLIENAEYSVQLGDMAFNYVGLNDVGWKHVFIMGNHDNYDDPPVQSLGDFGTCDLGPYSFYFVRGAWSIDVRHRRKMMAAGRQKCWWHEEELTKPEMEQCLEEYRCAQPDVVMTHSCPASISEKVGSPGIWAAFGWPGPRVSNTQQLLQAMYEVHQPKIWLFGHFHKNWIHVSKESTSFICIDELSYVDFNEGWEMV